MAFKIEVKDRIPTYPGRVTLTPVSGATNTYTLTRADMPVEEGTPINKVLFDSKADALTEDVIVYVDTSGNDISGEGTIDAPFATVQKAIDVLPKNLGGHTAQVSVGFGVFAERVRVADFHGGKLVIGRQGEVFIINGIEIVNSSFVETNIYQVERATGSNTPVFVVKDGSNVLVGNDMVIDCLDTSIVGMAVENNSRVSFKMNSTFTANNCLFAVTAQWCSFVSLYNITGTNDVFGMSASQGAIVSYRNDTIEKMWSNNADSGGLILTGENSTDLSNATLDL